MIQLVVGIYAKFHVFKAGSEQLHKLWATASSTKDIQHLQWRPRSLALAYTDGADQTQLGDHPTENT
jgi:hypothetical protein